MFKKLFNKNTVPCACEGNNENCDLVLSLREKQKLSKQIKNEIEVANKNKQDTLNIFVDFLDTIDEYGLSLYNFTNYGKECKMLMVERVINRYLSSDYIDKMAKLLSTYTTNVHMIAEKQKALKVVEDEIKDIKSKLGIE